MSTMGDTEFDATSVYSCCVDARTPGLHGCINRKSNRELFERQPSYPRTVDEEQVEPDDLFHIVFVYAKDDYDTFMDFLGWFNEILKTIENSQSVKIATQDSEHFPCPYDDNVHDISERAMFILLFLTKSFCTDEVLKFFTSEAIGKTRLDQTFPKGALEKTLKQQKKYAVRPIHTADPRSGTYRTPTGLTMMKGVEYYSKDKHALYVKDQVIRVVKEAIKKYEERKRVMVNVPTTSENEMANMLSAMKNVDLNPVTTEHDTSLEVDSGPSRQHNITTCEMAIGQKAGNLDDELKKLDALLMKSKYIDLRVEDVPGDGDCLYHSFIRNNHIHGLPDGPKKLRRQLVKYLESNPNTPAGVSYKDFLCLPLDQDHGIIEPEDMAIERVENVENRKELRWQRFLKKVHEGEWGGSLEILGLSQMYDVPVTVLSVMGSRLDEVKFNHTHKTTRNPVIYIGHLRLNGMGAHFVALRPFEEKAVQQPASFQQGELLRKMENNNFLYLEGQIIYKGEHSERIGCIKVTLHGKESHGTGFRVGSKYFMTAFHVMEDVLILFWEEVYRRLTEEVQGQMEWTKDKIPVDGAWKLSKLLPFVDPIKRNELMEIGKQTITNLVQIKFGFVRDNEYNSLAKCSYEVAFASPSHDVVILELIEDTNLPNPFHLKTINAAATNLHVIGHPGGKRLEHDPSCKIIKDQKELENLVKEGISFFTSRGYREDQVKEDYKPCVLSPDRLFFHCSKSITHGASGSPLIVIINEKEAQVIGMLLRGHPKFYYNYVKRNGDRPDLLVESGISMEKVRSLLVHHSLHDLAADIFPEQF